MTSWIDPLAMASFPFSTGTIHRSIVRMIVSPYLSNRESRPSDSGHAQPQNSGDGRRFN